jgi:uncharacterized SAM-binding protein YcdF (DUF218 family)
MIDILKALVIPSNLCFLMAAIGLALCVAARTRKVALVVLASAGLLLVVFSSGKTATLLLSPLEYAYPQAPAQDTHARAIVILAAYAADDSDMPLSSRTNGAGLYRVVEGVHLWRRCQDCTVIVTGFSPTTDVMAELVVSLGVPQAQVQIDSDAANTSDSAANMRRTLGDRPFFLVTSAGHMPRSMGVFTKAGLRPLPAPTDHQLPKTVADANWHLSTFHLQCSDLAVHEHIGMWWYRLRGRL